MAHSHKAEVNSLETLLESNLPTEELKEAWRIIYGSEYPPKSGSISFDSIKLNKKHVMYLFVN